MGMLDVFRRKEFSMVSLTESINLQPVVPGRLARHFMKKGIRTTSAAIEEKYGQLTLIQSAARGSQPHTTSQEKRVMRNFVIPHLPHNGQVLAADVQDLRAFGTEDRLAGVNEMIDQESEQLANDHETTWEWHRAGAIQGVVYDADGTVIHNYFNEFGIAETVITIDSSVPGSFRKGAIAISRALEDAMGATPMTGMTAYCGDQFWDAFTCDPQVRDSFERWRDGEYNRQNPRRAFNIWDIDWEEYRTKLGNRYFIDRTVARIVVEGRGMFQHISAPADTMKAVNTMGKPMYMMQKMMDFDKGVTLHSQSNPLFIPKRPKTLIKVVII